MSIFTGHYVPQLAKKIHEYNKGCQKPIINLKGFMVKLSSIYHISETNITP